MISVTVTGSYKKTKKFLKKASKTEIEKLLAPYAERGVEALRAATPVDTGKTRDSWRYEIKIKRNGPGIYWFNTNQNDGVIIAILLQYGHATRNGGYVQGIDYINPALRPIFDELAEAAWREVTQT